MPALTTFGETMLRLSPPSTGRLETATELELRIGGAESNVAIAAANLGIDVAWLSKLPQNPLGRRVTRDLLANGVEPAIAWDSRSSSRLGTYYLEPGKPPRVTNVIYDRTNSAVTTATPDDLDLELIRDATYFCTSGITPALSDTLRETTGHLLEIAAAAGTRTVLDLNYRSKLWSRTEAAETMDRLLPMVDVICGAERDARSVLGGEGDIETVVTDLRSAYEADLVVLTRGDDGAVAAERGETIHRQPAYPAETVDPIGTGDAFLGGFLAHRIKGDAIPAALDAGAAAAALSRTMNGDWPVLSPEEIPMVRDGETGISR